jgi:hypothetical protein
MKGSTPKPQIKVCGPASFKIEGLINFLQKKKNTSLVCDGFILKFEKLVAVIFIFQPFSLFP